MTHRRTISHTTLLRSLLIAFIAAQLLPAAHAAASNPAESDAIAAPPATSTATPAPASTTQSATATPAVTEADKDDDDDDTTNGKPAPSKHGLFGPKKLPYCKPGEDPGPKKTCRIKLPKMTPVNITDGTLTVDGMIAKVGLNYQIADLKYLYFWVPGTGIYVVGDKPFPNAKEEPAAFHGHTLTVTVNDRSVQLYSDQFLLKKERKEISAWVLLDPTLAAPSDDPHFRSPTFGWGVSPAAPYSWPGSNMSDPKKHALAPPVPTNLRPVYVKPVPVTLSLGATKPAATAATPAPAATASTPPAQQ